MSRPRRITDTHRAVLLTVAIERRRIPSDKELARALGVSVRAVQYAMNELLRVCEVSRGASGGNIASHEKANQSRRQRLDGFTISTRTKRQSWRQAEERAQSTHNRFLECAGQ